MPIPGIVAGIGRIAASGGARRLVRRLFRRGKRAAKAAAGAAKSPIVGGAVGGGAVSAIRNADESAAVGIGDAVGAASGLGPNFASRVNDLKQSMGTPKATASSSVYGGGGGGGNIAGYIGACGPGGSKRKYAMMLLASGGLDAHLVPPIRYESEDGGVIYRAPFGHVIVRWMAGGIKYVRAMERTMARNLGLWKPRKKPLISTSETTAIRKAASAKRKLAKAAKSSGLYVANKRPTTTTKRAPARRRRAA